MRLSWTYAICIAVVMMVASQLFAGRYLFQHAGDTDNSNFEPNFNQAQFGELTMEEHFVPISPHSCVKTATFYGDLKTTICVKPSDYISTEIINRGAWEIPSVNSVVKALSLYSDATFIDIGCNIGMYTTLAAAMGRQVVCVDAWAINSAYVWHSLKSANNNGRVRILNNAVSDDHTVLYPVGDKEGYGKTSMQTKEQTKNEKSQKIIGPPVHSVTVMDILATIKTQDVIMKLDIEAYECKALRPEVLQGRSGKKIVIIFMEWILVMGNKETCPDFDDWLQSFYRGGYTPYNAETLSPLPEWTRNRWKMNKNLGRNIAWIHSSFKLEELLKLY